MDLAPRRGNTVLNRLSRFLEKAAWNAHGDDEPRVSRRTLVIAAVIVLAALYYYEYTH
jgi:hypothetical protein